jgi:hypothetical protein
VSGLYDRDGIDGPFDRAMNRAMRDDSLRLERRAEYEAARHGRMAIKRIREALNPPATLHQVYRDVDHFVADRELCAKNSARSAAHYALVAIGERS